MRNRYLIVVGVAVLAVCGLTVAQQNSPKPNPVISNLRPPGMTPGGDFPPVNIPVTAQPIAETTPENMSIDQLIDSVEKLREQKAELEKKEAAFMDAIRKKAGKQKQRIDKLEGVARPLSELQLPPSELPKAP